MYLFLFHTSVKFTPTTGPQYSNTLFTTHTTVYFYTHTLNIRYIIPIEKNTEETAQSIWCNFQGGGFLVSKRSNRERGQAYSKSKTICSDDDAANSVERNAQATMHCCI